MKKIIAIIAIVLGIFIITAAAVFGVSEASKVGYLLYKTNYEAKVVDTDKSPDGEYELILQSVGEPHWPFGSAPGRLLLKRGETTVSSEDIEIANDGCSFSANSWSVTWYDDYAEVILSGEEQYDESLMLYFNGETERQRLKTQYGIEEITDTDAPEVDDTEAESETELFTDEQQITDGYRAIYELCSDNSSDDFEVFYGASEASSRCILSENGDTVEYLIYNGKSYDEKYGIYVLYQSDKNDDDTYSYDDGDIIDIYFYEFENGEVTSSGGSDVQTEE